MNKLRLSTENRSVTYFIFFGVWLIVAIYAILHDQYIVRISPEHFTIYHAPLWEIMNPQGLAAIHAFGASFSPGLLLGVACSIFARAGTMPKISIKFILLGTLIVVLLTEVISVCSGYFVYSTNQLVYPLSWYPNQTLPLLITQTIQVTCYFTGAFLSMIFLLLVIWMRFRLKIKLA